MRGTSLFLITMVTMMAQDATSRAVALFDKGQYGEAREVLVKSGSQEGAAVTMLAVTNAALGKCDEALPVLRASHENRLERMVLLARVQCELALQRWEDAVATASLLRQKLGDDPDAMYWSARVEMRAFDATVQRLYEKAPDSYRVNQLSAEILEVQGKLTDAVLEYRKAIAKRPNALNLHYRLGRALLLSGTGAASLSEAKKEFAAELALNPEDAVAEYQLGALASAEGDAAESAKRWQRALELRPDFAEALVALGKVKVATKDYGSAITLLERAVALQPKSEPAHYNLMLAYRNAGDLAKAKQQMDALNQLRKPPQGEFNEFLKKLGEKPSNP